jgi:hypothetical protein
MHTAAQQPPPPPTILHPPSRTQVRERRIPASDHFDFAAFMADPASVREWNIKGLPADGFSTENGVMVSRGKRWPLMIDPQVSALPGCMHAWLTGRARMGSQVTCRPLLWLGRPLES